LTPLIGLNSVPFITYFPAVLFVAWYAGFRAAACTVLLSAITADYYFVAPVGSFMISHAGDQLMLLIFVLVGLGMALLGHSQRQALSRAAWESGERRDAEQAEREHRHRLQTTLSSIGDAVLSTDSKGRIVFANRVAESVLGISEAEILGKHLDDVFQIVNEYTRATVESPVAKVLREGSIVGLANHTVLLTLDGREVPIDDSAAPIRDADGRLYGTVLVFRDVTDRRQAEATRQLLASIVENSEDAIISKDMNGVVTSWNKAAERIFGYSREEILGQSIFVLSPSGIDDMPKMLEGIQNGEQIDHYETVRRTKDGSLIHVSLRISPVRDVLGRIVGASKIARDITERKHAEEALRTLNTALVRANEDLKQFAFAASHDLQEPLRMITSYSQLLSRHYRGSLEGEVAICVRYISEGTARMRELLGDLLAYTQLSAEEELPEEALDLNLIAEKAVNNLKVAIDENKVQLLVGELPIVHGQSSHFLQIFQNLIGNAIKYRSGQLPEIRVSAARKDSAWLISVSDNGIGIDPEYHDRIFGVFKRLHSKEIAGTGIGLAICQRAVERYGGRIWVESQAGSGATFYFTVPIAKET
jgi:PAS domain S-box-containing protein